MAYQEREKRGACIWIAKKKEHVTLTVEQSLAVSCFVASLPASLKYFPTEQEMQDAGLPLLEVRY